LQQRYLLGNTVADLAAYQQARAALQQAMLRVPAAQVVAEGRPDWRALENAIARRIELMEQAVMVRRQAGLEAATAVVGSALNRQLHDEIDGLASRIKTRETQESERSKEETRQTGQTVKRLILLGGLLSFGVLAWAILVIIRSQAKYRRMAEKFSDSEIMNRAVTQSMAEGVVTANQDGVIVNANSAAPFWLQRGRPGGPERRHAAAKALPDGFCRVLQCAGQPPSWFQGAGHQDTGATSRRHRIFGQCVFWRCQRGRPAAFYGHSSRHDREQPDQ